MEFNNALMSVPMPTMKNFQSKAEALQFAIEFAASSSMGGRKVEPQDLCDGMHIMGYKYKVETGKHCCMCFDLFHAVQIWFYTLFSRL